VLLLDPFDPLELELPFDPFDPLELELELVLDPPSSRPQNTASSFISSVLTSSAVARRRGSALATTATEATTMAREKNRWAIILFVVGCFTL